MESAIQSMVKVFLKSTKGKESLGQSQFQGLVKSQLSNILSDTESKEAIKNMGQGLDANHDGKVGFEEYLKLVGYLAVSMSEQRNLAKEEPAQNAASEPCATGPDKEEAKPEANAEAKEEAKPEANAEAKEEAKPEANAEAKEEAKPEANAEAKEEAKPEANNAAKVEAFTEVKVLDIGEMVEIKSVGETLPEAAMSEAEKAVGPIILGETDLSVSVNSDPGIVAPEMEIPRLTEEVEKKIEEATS